MKLQRLGRVLAVCTVVFLTACGTVPRSGPAPVEKTPDHTPVKKPAIPQRPDEPQRAPLNSAAQSLMQKADYASGNGDFEQALALLERALRIDPDSAEIYLAQAKTYKNKGDTAMASAAAQRGLLYCNGSAQCNALRAYAP